MCLYCREISVEKLNLDTDSPPKAETRRDVVDAPTASVSERGGGRRPHRGSHVTISWLPTCSLWLCSGRPALCELQ